MDTSNLYYNINVTHNFKRLSYKELLLFLSKLGDVVHRSAYGGQLNDEAESFILRLEELGFITKYKEPQITEVKGRSKRRLNWSVGIMMDIIRYCTEQDVDIIVIASSNPDIQEGVKYIVKDMHKDVIILACNIPTEFYSIDGVTCIEVPASLLETSHSKRKNENT